VECLIIIFLSEAQLSYLEKSVATVELLVWVLGNLLKVKDSVSLLGLLIFNAFCEDFSNVEMGLDIRSIFFYHALQVCERLLKFAVMVSRQASFHVALLEQLLIVRFVLLLVQ